MSWQDVRGWYQEQDDPDPVEDLKCIHSDSGLCPDCQKEFDLDPQAWLEYGDHPAGLDRLVALRAEIAQEALDAARMDDAGESLPF